MKLCIIIPVKPFAQAKSRLAPVLRKPMRAILARSLLSQTLDTLLDFKLKTFSQSHSPVSNLQVLVISRDLLALDIARSKGVAAVMESGYNLNSALAEAQNQAIQNAAEAILVLPADLLLLTAQDIKAIVDSARQPTCAVIAPDRRELGTNALLLRPPDALCFAFGPHSFDVHCAQAQTANIKLHIYRSPTIAFDLDTPSDLAALRARKSSA